MRYPGCSLSPYWPGGIEMKRGSEMAPSVSASTTATVSTTREVRLTARQRNELRASLRIYAELSAQIKALELAKAKAKDKADQVREDLGEQSIELDGFTVTLVAPVRKKLNEKKLIAQGVTMAQIEMATDHVLVRPYTKITVPGGKEED